MPPPQVRGGPTNYSITSDGLLATSHSGEIVNFWDLETGELRGSLSVGMEGNAGTTAITPDGRWLYVTEGTENRIVSRVPLDVAELVPLARTRVQRGFTSEECERHFPAGDCPTS